MDDLSTIREETLAAIGSAGDLRVLDACVSPRSARADASPAR